MKSSQKLCRWVVLVAVCAFAIAADPPATRTITLRWLQDGEVSGFRVYQHTYLKPWDGGLDVGLPKRVDGIYICEVEVSNAEATWVAVASYNRVRQLSEKSEARLLLLPED